MRPTSTPLPLRRTLVALLAAAALPPPASHAVQGAAEMDLEFYARSLLGRPPSPPPPPAVEIAKPRELDADFATRVVSAVESSLAPSLDTTPSDLSERAGRQATSALARVQSRAHLGRLWRRPWLRHRDWRERWRPYLLAVRIRFGAARPVHAARRRAASKGARERVLSIARRHASRGRNAIAISCRCCWDATGTPTLKSLITGMRQLLTALQTNGYLQTYNLDDSDGDEALWAQKSDLSPTRLTLTLTDTASLRAALLLNGRSGASPELAAAAAARVLARARRGNRGGWRVLPRWHV